MTVEQFAKLHNFRYTESKNIKKAFATYRQSNIYDIMDAYKKPSQEKRTVFNQWRLHLLANSELVFGRVKVIYKNSNVFTIGWILSDNFDNKYFFYVTPSKRWFTSLNIDI